MDLRKNLTLTLVTALTAISCGKAPDFPVGDHKYKGKLDNYRVEITTEGHTSENSFVLNQKTGDIKTMTSGEAYKFVKANPHYQSVQELRINLRAATQDSGIAEIGATIAPPINQGRFGEIYLKHRQNPDCLDYFPMYDSVFKDESHEHYCGEDSTFTSVSRQEAEQAIPLLNEALERFYRPLREDRLERIVNKIYDSTGLTELGIVRKFEEDGINVIAFSLAGERLVETQGQGYHLGSTGTCNGNKCGTRQNWPQSDKVLFKEDFNGDGRIDYLLIVSDNLNIGDPELSWHAWLSPVIGPFFKYTNYHLTPEFIAENPEFVNPRGLLSEKWRQKLAQIAQIKADGTRRL